jgi:quinol monooxygenase YgiN
VYVTVKDGTEAAFEAATVLNASNSVLEQGVARFDVLRENDDPTKWVLVEVYKCAGC